MALKRRTVSPLDHEGWLDRYYYAFIRRPVEACRMYCSPMHRTRCVDVNAPRARKESGLFLLFFGLVVVDVVVVGVVRHPARGLLLELARGRTL